MLYDSNNVADLFTRTRLLTCFFIIKRKQRCKVQAQITSSSAVTRGAFALGLRPLNCPRRRTSSLATGFTESSNKEKLLMDWSYELKRSHNVADHEHLSVSFFSFLDIYTNLFNFSFLINTKRFYSNQYATKFQVSCAKFNVLDHVFTL
jgi:hypothetical protein